MDCLKPTFAFFFFISCLLQTAAVWCQSPVRITLSEKQVTLESIIRKIADQSGYDYGGDATWAELGQPVSLSVKNAPVREVLNLCFRAQPHLYYTLIGNYISIYAKTYQNIAGRIVNDKQEPVAGATILVAGSKPLKATMSDDSGHFQIRTISPDSILRLSVSCINYEPQVLRLVPGRKLLIQLQPKVGELDHVVVSNGYQDIPKDRATGSFAMIDNDLFNRRVSPDILSRIDGVASGVLFNANVAPGTNQSGISIRGRSTIFSNPNPLIVVDNFPYSGDINNINPNDVERITVLKDAAAASIWGALSGNGVIVITTRKGRFNEAPQWSFNSNMTIGEKPNLYYTPILSSNDYIDVEQFLFSRHFYDGVIMNPYHPALSPVVDILAQQSQGLLNAKDARTRIDALRGQDSRRDLDKYFYRTSLHQQYYLNLQGGSAANQYYVSGGFDRDGTNLVRNDVDRATLTASNTCNLIPKKLAVTTAIAFTHSMTGNNNPGLTGGAYPYQQLADAQGHALAIPYVYRQGYVDTVGAGRLLDWHYRPLDELRFANNTTRLIDYRVNLESRYTIGKGLDAHLYYQFSKGVSDNQNDQSLQTYYTRDLINSFTQVDGVGNLTRPVPLGGILDKTVNSYQANNYRLQLNYNHQWKQYHNLNILAGAELQDVEGDLHISRLYGYDQSAKTGQPVNYTMQYPQYVRSFDVLAIPNPDLHSTSSDHYLSYYINGAYTYRQRYILSASARKDESNLFGVKANQKGIPLWSLGGAWEISREPFYRVSWLPLLRLRVTDGYNGNVDKSFSGYTSASSGYASTSQATLITSFTNSYGASYADITNPPNPDLRWERVHIYNAGLDFDSKYNKVEGSLEYYIKYCADLIAPISLAPSTGNPQYTGNAANMITHGVDLTIRTNAVFGKVSWHTTLLFSVARDRVTKYFVKPPAIATFFNNISVNPLLGRPVYSVYALRWEGLDPLTGDPQGWLNGHVSKSYESILNSSDYSNLVYKGPANPPVFGSFRNTLNWKQWAFSFNIIYKFGYYFRRTSIDYYSLFAGTSQGHPDYDKRWQHPGDEKHTNVPSMNFPAGITRDEFYDNSEVLVEKGDHIRLQDLQCSYDWTNTHLFKLPVPLIRLYGYVNNVGILWRANRQGIDPDAALTGSYGGPPRPRTYALGIKLEW
jgi:TonB-linked SusC/RagA family outer membrane protein